jgi:DNA-binding NarL/FixJ family response regulator
MIHAKHVLIIEDEPMAIENYERALISVENNPTSLKFSIDQATNCHEAFNKIKIAIIDHGLDLVFLDIRLRPTPDHKIQSGEDLGIMIRKHLSNTKIIVITSHHEAFRLNNIMNTVQPEGFLVKGDIVFSDLIKVIEKVMDHKNHFSHTVATLLKRNSINKATLNDVDVKLLHEISNGAKMKELVELLPLTKSGIEKRRTTIKVKFGDRHMSDRDMILIAKEKGFI